MNASAEPDRLPYNVDHVAQCAACKYWVAKGLPKRVANILAADGIHNLDRLGQFSTRELARLPNMGKIGLQAINLLLSREVPEDSRACEMSPHQRDITDIWIRQIGKTRLDAIIASVSELLADEAGLSRARRLNALSMLAQIYRNEQTRL